MVKQPTIDIRADRITPRARAWLTASGPIRTLHIFTSVCNLVDSTGAVLSLQTERVSISPMSLVVDSRSLGRPGSRGFSGWLEGVATIERRGRVLRLGPLAVDWESAAEWNPRPDWDRIRMGARTWSQHLPALVDRLRSGGPAGGLSGLLAGGMSRETADTSVLGRLVAAARAPAQGVLAGLGAMNVDRRAIDGAQALAGLGGGLTPAGDDFLIGVMHALWATRDETAAKEISEKLAQAAAPRTTPLSAAWLLAAAAGEAAGHWHDLLEALVQGEAEAIDQNCLRLLSVGHSSGADALTGFLGALWGPSLLGSGEGS